MEHGPWSFYGKLLLLKEIVPGEQPAEMVFDVVRFWVKAYQLPVDKRKKSMAVAMANKMGKFVEFDSSDPFGYKKFMRFRVNIDPCKPLMRGMKVLECSFYDEEIPESSYPYGNWLRASPTRNRFRNDVSREGDLRLLEEFKKTLSHSRARQRLTFNDGIEGEVSTDANEKGKWKVDMIDNLVKLLKGEDVDIAFIMEMMRIDLSCKRNESGMNRIGALDCLRLSGVTNSSESSLTRPSCSSIAAVSLSSYSTRPSRGRLVRVEKLPAAINSCSTRPSHSRLVRVEKLPAAINSCSTRPSHSRLVRVSHSIFAVYIQLARADP
ncbi:Homeobox protein Hox-A7 [Bienertia sinuspersici]